MTASASDTAFSLLARSFTRSIPMWSPMPLTEPIRGWRFVPSRAAAPAPGAPKRCSVVAEPLLFDRLDRRQPRGRAQGVLLVGVVADRTVGADVVPLPRHDPRQGEDPAAERLAQNQDVRG